MADWTPTDEVADTIRDLVLLYLPDPAGPGRSAEQRELEEELLNDARNQLQFELMQLVEGLDAVGPDREVEVDDDGDIVPGEGDDLSTRLVLEQLGRWAQRRAEANAHITLLLTYAREFVDDPPPLARLARIVDMSVSGIRTAYGDRERAEVATRLGRGPARGRLAPVWRGESSPHGFLLGVDEFGSWVSVPLADTAMLQLDAPTTDPTVLEVSKVLRGQAHAAGWRLHRISEAELIAAARDYAEEPTRGAATLDLDGPALLEVGEPRSGAPAAAAAATPTREDYAAVAALLAKRPQTHLLWAGVGAAAQAALGDQPILRRPGRRHEQFWVLEVPGQTPQRVRPARADQAASTRRTGR